MILGARQVGKTTLIKHVLSNKSAIFFNFDIDVDVNRFFALTSLPPKDALYSIGNPDFLVIDEAQRKPDVFRIVKGWFDSNLPVKIILLGSSSADIAKHSAESLIGRNEKINLPALVFPEVLQSQSWFNASLRPDEISKSFQNQIEELLMQSVVFGSYPEVVLTGDKRSIVTNLAVDYLLKDILQLGLIRDPETIRRLISLVARQIGSTVSINELANTLNISRSTVERYLNLLEQTYVIFRLPAYSTNPRKELTKSQKIFFWDTGIRNAVLGEFSMDKLRADIGPLWENWVIAEVAKHNLIMGSRNKLFFWRARDGSEIDLVFKNGDKIKAIEIKWSDTGGRNKAFRDAYNIDVQNINRFNALSIQEFAQQF